MINALYPFVLQGLKKKIRGASKCKYACNSFLLTVDASVGEDDILGIMSAYCKKVGCKIKKWEWGLDLILPADASGISQTALICVAQSVVNQPQEVVHVVVTALTYASRPRAVAKRPGRPQRSK